MKLVSDSKSLPEICERQRIAFEAMVANPCYKTAAAYIEITDAFVAASRSADEAAE